MRRSLESLRRSPLALGLAFAAWSIAPIVALLVRARLEHGTFGGAFSPLAGNDGFRYLAWVRDAGDHGLIGDPLGGTPDGQVYLNPLFLGSGIAWKAGLSLQVAYLLWLPLALTVLYQGFSRYVARCCPENGWSRPAALVLALFYVTPLLPLLDWGSVVDALSANHLLVASGGIATYWRPWGHLPATIALGLLPLLLLGIERALVANLRPSAATLTSALLMAWLHPWAGLTALGIVGGLAVWTPGARRVRPLAPIVGALVLPLAYYAILARAGPAWSLARLPGNLALGDQAALLAALAPLGLAAVGLGGRELDLQERMLRLWPVSAAMCYVVLGPGEGLAALGGIALPLAILAVRGWQRFGLPAPAAVVAIGLLTVPGLVYCAQAFRDSVRGAGVPYAVRDDEQAAFAALRVAPGSGAAMTPSYFTGATAALGGRRVRAGSDRLYSGRLGADRVRAETDEVDFVLSDCRRPHADLGPVLAPLGFETRRYGCVRLHERRLRAAADGGSVAVRPVPHRPARPRPR